MIVNKQLAKNYKNRLNWVVVIVRQIWRVFLNHSVELLQSARGHCPSLQTREGCGRWRE